MRIALWQCADCEQQQTDRTEKESEVPMESVEIVEADLDRKDHQQALIDLIKLQIPNRNLEPRLRFENCLLGFI